ncbi:hypothetical protein BIW11_09867, partial [Tropilaelaps mercedesae]
EDDFAEDVKSYVVPSPRPQASVPPFPGPLSLPNKLSVKPSGYARPKISKDEDWDFDVKSYVKHRGSVTGGTGGNVAPATSTAWSKPATNYGGWTSSINQVPPPGAYGPGPAYPSAKMGWSPFDDGTGPSQPDADSWYLSGIKSAKPNFGPSLSSAGGGGWSPPGGHTPTQPPKRPGAAYGPSFESSKPASGGWLPSTDKSVKPNFGLGTSSGAGSRGWSLPGGHIPIQPPKTPGAAYEPSPGSSKPASGGWLPSSGKPVKSSFGPGPSYGAGSGGWLPQGDSTPTQPPKRPGAAYRPSFESSKPASGGRLPPTSQSVKPNFGPGPSSGAGSRGWLPQGDNTPTQPPKKLEAGYRPSSGSSKPASGGWLPPTGQSVKSSFGPRPSYGAGSGGWLPQGDSTPTQPPKKSEAAYRPSPELSKPASRGWLPSSGQPVKSSFGPGPLSGAGGGGWSPPGGHIPTQPPKRPGAAYGPSFGSSKPASGGWLPPTGQSVKPNFGPGFSSGAGSRGGSLQGGHIPTQPPKTPGATYGPSPGSSKPASGGWLPSSGQPVKSSFGPGSLSGAGGGGRSLPGGHIPTQPPKRPGAAYRPSFESSKPASGGWLPPTGQSVKPNLGPGPSSGAGSRGWLPQGDNVPTQPPKKLEAGYRPSPGSSKPASGGWLPPTGQSVKSSFGPRPSYGAGSGKWLPQGDSTPTQPPKKSEAAYKPSPELSKPASGGWLPSSGQAVKSSFGPGPSSGAGSGEWSPPSGHIPTQPPKKPGAAYEPPSASKSRSPSAGQSKKPNFGLGQSSGAGSGGWSPPDDHIPIQPPKRPGTAYRPSSGSSKSASRGWSPSAGQSVKPSFGPEPSSGAGSGGWSSLGGGANSWSPSGVGFAKPNFGLAPSSGTEIPGWTPSSRAARPQGSHRPTPAYDTSTVEKWSLSREAQPGKQANTYRPIPGGRPGDRSAQFGSGSAMPYDFRYNIDLDEGNIYREEKGDETGKVTGIYTIRTNDGVDRRVKYMADQFGFHAEVDTNEQGTANQNPADVVIRSNTHGHSASASDGGGRAPASSFTAGQKAQNGFRDKQIFEGFGGGRGNGYANPNAGGGWDE